MAKTVQRTDGDNVNLTQRNADNAGPFTTKMENYSSGQPKYIGEALPGTATSLTKWRIKLMEYDDGTSSPPTGQTWASGTADFDKEWDERASYSYS